MLLSRRRLGSAAVLAASTLGVSIPFTAAAHAVAPSVQLAFNGSSNDPLVSGVMDVSATITTDTPITHLTYALPNGSQQQVALQSGQCDTSCTAHWTVDTAADTDAEPGGLARPTVLDGAASLSVWATNATGTQPATGTFRVDNHRPTLSPSPIATGIVLGTAEQIQLTVTPTVSPTAPSGTTITDVEVETGRASGWPVSHLTRNADGSWTTHFAADSLPGGLFHLGVLAVDSNGATSTPDFVTVGVDAGFALTPPPAVVTPDWSSLKLSAAFTGWQSGCGPELGTAVIADVQLKVDGTPWHDATSKQWSLDCSFWGGGSWNTPNLKPLPLGKHTLTWTVTDSQGVKETVSEPVTVALPLSSDWPTLDQSVIAGNTLRVKPKIIAPDGFSTLQSWTISLNGNQIASGAGTTQPALSLPTSTTRLTGGLLALHLVSSNGLTTDQKFTFQTGWATSAYIHASATSLKRGGSLTLSSTDWQRIAGTWRFEPALSGSMQYQWKVPGGAWHNEARFSLSPSNRKPGNVTVRPGGSVCFRVIFSPNQQMTQFGDASIPATSAPLCVAVK